MCTITKIVMYEMICTCQSGRGLLEHVIIVSGIEHHISECGKLLPDGATFLVNRSYRVPKGYEVNEVREDEGSIITMIYTHTY